MSHRGATGFGGAMDPGGDDHDDDTPGLPPDDDLDVRPGALPHPLDRIWLHPSELAPVGAMTSPPRGGRPWATTLVAGATGAILTLAVLGAVGALDRPAEHVSEPNPVPTSAPIVTAQALAIAAAHSVVAVSAHDARGTRRGSGVFVRRSGEVLTSDRLVGKATRIDVIARDGTSHRARVLGRDATTDLVLLGFAAGGATAVRVPASFAVPAPLASRAPKTGDTVWVVGAPSPGGSSPWLSDGLVASTDSLLAVERGPTTSGLLETAAASSAASSGGALVDRSGNVTGIVLSPVRGERMTYAVPIRTALSIADDLRVHGHATHGALGINGVNAPAGPMVTSMITGGPADRAGVRVGDIVESVDRHLVYSMNDVMALVRHDRPGQPVELELQRGSNRLRMVATLTAMITP